MDSGSSKSGAPSREFLCTLAVIFVFIIVIWPPFWNPYDGNRGRTQSCMSNMRQVGLGMLQYAQDNDEQLPPRQFKGAGGAPVSWRVAIYPYIKSLQVFRCPANPVATGPSGAGSRAIKDSDFPRSYAVNSTSDDARCFGPFSGKFPRGFPIIDAPAPSSLAIMVESTAAYNDFNVLNPRVFRWPTSTQSQTGNLFCGHKGMTNVLFCDGHVHTLQPRSLLGTSALGPNPWTTDNAPFSPANQAKATSVVEYGAKQNR